MADIIGQLDGLGMAGIVSGIVGKVYETKKNWNLDKEVKVYLKELENASVQDIEEQLVAFFAFDLQKAIEKHQIPNTVIFLDTFEALWSGLSNKAVVHTKDKWVRDLIGSSPNILFIICGREYLEWEKYDADWKKIIKHQMVHNFDEKNASQFLEQSGIKEEAIRHKMITSSGGYPYHLDLSVDTYFEMKNRGEQLDPSRFGSNHREILDRFLQYLSDQEIETLKIMSIARFYNKDLFQHLLTEHPTGYAITKYDNFNKFSFITCENDKLFIHALMRQGMLDYSSKDLIKSVHKTLADYYARKFTYEELEMDQEKDIETLSEQIYHQKSYLTQKQLIDWLSEEMLPTLKKLQLRGESRFLRETLSELYSELGAKGLGISLMQILVDMVHLNGEYEQAIAMIDELFEGLDTEEILESQQACHLFIRKVHHQMFSHPVDALIQELLEIEPILAKKNWPKEYNELIFMLGGNLGVLSGNMTFSRKWLVKAIRFAEENNQMNYYCRALRKYVDILKINGHVKWAKEFCEKGIRIANENGYERYAAILVVTLADLYRMENNNLLCEELLEKGMQMIKRVGIKGWIGHIHGSYAEMYFQKGEYEKAAEKWQEAITIYRSINLKWGLIVGAIGLERCRLQGAAIESMEQMEKSLELANALHYRREQEFIGRTINGERDILALPFL
ncbi:tetratricopeptide repeat protein [Oceanobacillus chungangensis]|uniref:Uncharacterized protein n=1 Tax=Oceanobacillus chungangensis TaxID=1229152 RepID=A0A3D8PWJ7_9BACI|nr:tetratricopeptide repeat protein [Oceanobacillus chungangensis]RDW19691.1 hypothetical protein CWR45_06320 [Oceanobacillus chungangensis]